PGRRRPVCRDRGRQVLLPARGAASAGRPPGRVGLKGCVRWILPDCEMDYAELDAEACAGTCRGSSFCNTDSVQTPGMGLDISIMYGIMCLTSRGGTPCPDRTTPTKSSTTSAATMLSTPARNG